MFRFHKTDRQLLAAIFVLLLAVRAVLLAIYGPVEAPDSGGYIAYANIILAGQLNNQSLAADLAPHTVFRMIGYPAVLAAGLLVAGKLWAWLVVALQILLTLASVAALYRVALLLCGTRVMAVLAGLAYGLSMPLVFDQMILTDSLAASVLILAACHLAVCILQRRPLRWQGAVVAGMLLAITFLIREASLLLAGTGLLPLALAAAFADRWPERPWRLLRLSGLPRIAIALAVLLPVLLTWQGYRLWNADRLGVPLVTSVGQSTILQGLAVSAQRNPAVFDRSHVFDRVAAETFSTYSFDEIWLINGRLYKEYGMTADRIASAAYTSYFRAWLREPLSMLWIPLYHVRMSVVLSPFQPFASVRLLHLWATGEALELGTRRAMQERNWTMLPVFLMDTVCRAFAIAIFAAFLFGTPWRLLRQGWTPQVVVSLGFLGLFVAMHAGYAMVHLEPRYLMPAIAGGTVVGLFNLRDLWQWYRKRRRGGMAEAG